MSPQKFQLPCFPLKMIDGKLPEGMVELIVNGNKVMVKKSDYQMYKASKEESPKDSLKAQPLKLTADGKVPEGKVRLLINGKPFMAEKTEYVAHQRRKVGSSEKENNPDSKLLGNFHGNCSYQERKEHSSKSQHFKVKQSNRLNCRAMVTSFLLDL